MMQSTELGLIKHEFSDTQIWEQQKKEQELKIHRNAEKLSFYYNLT